MKKEWIEQRLDEERQKLKDHKDRIESFIINEELILEDDKEKFISKLDAITATDYVSMLDFDLKFYPYIYVDVEDMTKFNGWRDRVESLRIEEYGHILHLVENEFCKRYLDGDPIEFDGDIIITDPNYIIRKEHLGTKPLTNDDWLACDCGENMEALGINTYITRDMLCGNCACTAFDSYDEKPLGEFGSDAGLVSVFLLDEILKYNPDYANQINPKAITLIKDFKGTVQFVVVRTEGVYENTTDWHTEGEKWEKYSVEIIGDGINKITGDPIHFVGKQTDL